MLICLCWRSFFRLKRGWKIYYFLWVCSGWVWFDLVVVVDDVDTVGNHFDSFCVFFFFILVDTTTTINKMWPVKMAVKIFQSKRARRALPNFIQSCINLHVGQSVEAFFLGKCIQRKCRGTSSTVRWNDLLGLRSMLKSVERYTLRKIRSNGCPTNTM